MNPLAMLRDMRTIRAMLEGSEAAAREMGEETPGAEHLLLAAMDLPDGAAARILGTHGVDRARLRTAIVEQHATALAAAGLDPDAASRLSDGPPIEPPHGAGVYRSQPSAQEAFQAAGHLARSSKERLSSAHVVAAVAAMEHGAAARALTRLGVDRSSLVAAAHGERRGR